ncbi:MAG: hypothetical protein EON92_05540 [Burkholderiales bacterium]|nr:MAG: hypothetical protein EON92_05540 [Burkholderiales bacterium]
MAADGQNVAHAYYPRLNEVLGLDPAEGQRLKNDFPATEGFWRGLNEYLESHEGQSGLPTAYSLGHRYVGIPQSQALVRATDRARLPKFFRLFGLIPGAEMIPSDVERVFDIWLGMTHCPVSANLRSLWSGKARERIAGVVAVELAHWDGSSVAGEEVEAGAAGDVQLTARLRNQFGSRKFDLSFAARLPRPVEAFELRVTSAVDEPAVGVVPAAGGRLVPRPGSRFDPTSLIGTMLELRHDPDQQVVRRRPRRVVPFRKDDLLGQAVEVDRVQLAEDVTLLVKDEEKLLNAVLDLVDHYGRRGELHRGTPSHLEGLPDGWVLIEEVQLFAVPQDVKRLDLNVLVPLTTAQLSFAGGLKLPGRIRKWSSLQPPEIRAAVADAEKMAITLRRLAEETTEVGRWAATSGAIVVPAAPGSLEDGDYEVELEVNGDPVSVSTLRLRSSDTPDAFSWETCWGR